MDKLEKLHFQHSKKWDCYNDAPYEENHARKSAEITADVAIKFIEWVDTMGYTQVSDSFFKSLSDEKGKTTRGLVEEFINNHYGK
jgi:hypothetical protein